MRIKIGPACVGDEMLSARRVPARRPQSRDAPPELHAARAGALPPHQRPRRHRTAGSDHVPRDAGRRGAPPGETRGTVGGDENRDNSQPANSANTLTCLYPLCLSYLRETILIPPISRMRLSPIPPTNRTERRAAIGLNEPTGSSHRPVNLIDTALKFGEVGCRISEVRTRRRGWQASGSRPLLTRARCRMWGRLTLTAPRGESGSRSTRVLLPVAGMTHTRAQPSASPSCWGRPACPRPPDRETGFRRIAPRAPSRPRRGMRPRGGAPLPEIPAAGDEATRVTLLKGGQSRGTDPPIPPGRSGRPRTEDVGAAPGHRALAAGDATGVARESGGRPWRPGSRPADARGPRRPAGGRAARTGTETRCRRRGLAADPVRSRRPDHDAHQRARRPPVARADQPAQRA